MALYWKLSAACVESHTGNKTVNLNVHARLGYVPEALCRIMLMLAVHNEVLVLSQFRFVELFLVSRC